MDRELTQEERVAVNKLKRLAKTWPKTKEWGFMIDTCRGCGDWLKLNSCPECAEAGMCLACLCIHQDRCHTKGVHANRLEHPASNREKGFAQQWEHENQNTDMLVFLLDTPRGTPGFSKFPDDNKPLLPVSPRDRAVAATVIQWLGSNVGWSFIEEALRRSGFRITTEKLKLLAPSADNIVKPPQ